MDLSLSPDSTLLASGGLSLAGLAWEDGRVDVAEVSFSADGPLLRPVLDLQATVRGLVAGTTTVERADLTAVGGPTSYHVAGEVALAEGPLAVLDLTAQWNAGVLEADGPKPAPGCVGVAAE